MFVSFVKTSSFSKQGDHGIFCHGVENKALLLLKAGITNTELSSMATHKNVASNKTTK